MAEVLDPASAAVYSALKDIQAAGGVREDVPQPLALPLVLYELCDEQESRGLGVGSLPQLQLKVHIYSAVTGKSQAQALKGQVVDRLKDQRLAIAGFASCGAVIYDGSTQVPDAVLNGLKVHEILARFRWYVEAP